MASKKKQSALVPLSRNIVRHENKNGNFYYYNYKQNKITSEDSWKYQNARIKKRKEEIEGQEKKHRQYLKRKRESEKEKEQQKSHQQYLKRKRKAKKKKKEKEKEKKPAPLVPLIFPKEIDFFEARSVFLDVIFSGINLIIDFSDPANNFSSSYEGSSQDFSEWYTTSSTYLHLRKYHGGSPPARFELVETDGITYARYIITTP